MLSVGIATSLQAPMILKNLIPKIGADALAGVQISGADEIREAFCRQRERVPHTAAQRIAKQGNDIHGLLCGF